MEQSDLKTLIAFRGLELTMARIDPDSDLIRSCSRATGFTTSEVIAIASTAPRRYKTYEIPKRAGGVRLISQPSRELKVLQYYFLSSVLNLCFVHPAAMAYMKGRSISMNARAHVKGRVLLKTDFASFFPSIRVSDWSTYALDKFTDWTPADHLFSQAVLFFGSGSIQPVCLSIGAPTSPLISNILLANADEYLSNFCVENSLTYTRYADDITISSEGFIDYDGVVRAVLGMIAHSRIKNLKLNEEKNATYIAEDLCPCYGIDPGKSGVRLSRQGTKKTNIKYGLPKGSG